MTKKIFRAIFLVTAAAVIVSLIVTAGILYENFTTSQSARLESVCGLAARGVELEGMSYFDKLDAGDCRITWVAADGTVLYDSVSDAKTMENHAGRAEIAEALESGAGESERYSSTISETTIYRAKRISDGTVVRAAVTLRSAAMVALGMLYPCLVLLAAVLVISAVVASRLAKSVVKPLESLDLEHPLENDAYDELSPLLGRIEQQHRQLDNQLDKLRRARDEFSSVTRGMTEGLILLGKSGEILSVNPAAKRIFNTDDSCVGRDILALDRSQPVRTAVEKSLSGVETESEFSRGGRVYRLDASPSSGDARGAVLLAFDVTEKAAAESMRREFTANVSHELKTPLQSIMGSAELIESGLVKPEDLTRFAGKIRSESSRLVALIDDIIRLSRLDEGAVGLPETFDLLELAEEAALSVSHSADERGVTVSVHGAPREITAVRRLASEIVCNLADNAVKYNVPGGRVDITVAAPDSGQASGAALTVSDTGIGIAPEHCERVFERFYRVDKSHSKSTGGTGLGLSIVKHAAESCGASVSLSSAPGKGTTVTVVFK